MADTVVAAISAGYRHLDCAADYGNEVEVGQGIARAIKEGLVKREELHVTSKLWCTYHHPDHVELACKKSLLDLGLEYLDLYLIHFPISTKFVPIETRYPPEWTYDPSAKEPKIELVDVPVSDTWRAMEGLRGKGLVRDIGVANFNCQGLRDLVSFAKVKPAVLQVELHPLLQQPQLVRFAQSNGIHVTAYSPLGHGLSYWNDQISCLKLPAIQEIAKRKGQYPSIIDLISASHDPRVKWKIHHVGYGG